MHAADHGPREVAAADFWTGYRQTALAADELILRIRFPLRTGREMRFRKVGTRRAQSISKVVLAAAWREREPGRWRDVRIALGSVAATPIRATATEEVLEGAEKKAKAEAVRCKAIDDGIPVPDISRATYGEK